MRCDLYMTTKLEASMDCVGVVATNALPSSAVRLAVDSSVIYDRQENAALQPRPSVLPGAPAIAMGEHAKREAMRDEQGTPDDVLLTAVRRGNETALRSLYERYADLVYTVAVRIVGDRELAQEVLQDVFLRCWERADTFKSERGHVGGWLIGIARNRAVDLLRSSQHRARLREQALLALDGAEERPGQSDQIDQLALRQAVKTALEALPAVQRDTIELAFYGGFTQAEIAAATGAPLGTVKTRIRDGMQRLRSLLRPLIDPQCELTGSPVDKLANLR